MPKRAAISIEVCTDSKQGGRKYMEDEISVDFASKESGDFDYAFFAVYDGHGGPHASVFAKQHLMTEITKQKNFWSDDDECVKRSISDGFLSTHKQMAKVVGQWPRTLSGHPSTAGTTCSVVFITCDGKVYVGHVGDSGVLLGVSDKDGALKAHCVTVDHKPESPEEKKRIEESGGEVISRAGVPRVVWSRPKVFHKGPVRRSTELDHIPFLAVARSLGDLWSYNMETEKFVVSPQPDVSSYKLDVSKHKCIILASDGLWNMVKPQEALDLIQHYINNPCPNAGRNAAALLVQTALNRWAERGLRADNTSVIVVKLQDDTSGTPTKVAPVSPDVEVGAHIEIEGDKVMPPLTPTFSGAAPVPSRRRKWSHNHLGMRKSALKRYPSSPRIHRHRSSPWAQNTAGHNSVRAFTNDDTPMDTSMLEFVAVSKRGVKIYRAKNAMPPPSPGSPQKLKSKAEFVAVTKAGVSIFHERDVEEDAEAMEEEEAIEKSSAEGMTIVEGSTAAVADSITAREARGEREVEVYDQDIDLGAFCEVSSEEKGKEVPPAEMDLVGLMAGNEKENPERTSPTARRTSPRKAHHRTPTSKAASRVKSPKGSNSATTTCAVGAPSCLAKGKSTATPETGANVQSKGALPSTTLLQHLSHSGRVCNTDASTAGPSAERHSSQAASAEPMPAASAKTVPGVSALQVDISDHSPTPALVSPIWPSSLDTDGSLDTDSTLKIPLKEQLQPMQQSDVLRENAPTVSRRTRHVSEIQTPTQGTQNISPVTRLSRKRKNSLDSGVALPISKRLRARISGEHKRLKPSIIRRTRNAFRSTTLARS